MVWRREIVTMLSNKKYFKEKGTVYNQREKGTVYNKKKKERTLQLRTCNIEALWESCCFSWLPRFL